eukprot:scaffold195571_cov36-Attheya_sp.AAC.2
MSVGGVFPCRTNEEGNITMPIRLEYEVMCLWGLYEATTADVIKEAVTAPVLDPTWDCDGRAPVDVEGYPLTQYYNTPDDECVLLGPTPAFAPINQNMPTSQYARSNVPIEDDELWAKPTIYTCDDRFFNTYDLLPNLLVATFRNTPHQETDYFKAGANYSRELPNINGQFVVLHHNVYPETTAINVYDRRIVMPHHTLDVYDYTHHHHLGGMSELDRMNHVDDAFLGCRDDEERTVLWSTMVPTLVKYEAVFCSVCCCWLPGFYFTKNQCQMKRTRRACRHCETNRKEKIAQINRILGSLSYFLSPRQCAICLDYRCKHEFTNGRWKRT